VVKKQIHPGVAIAVVMIALILVVFIYYKQTESPPPAPMSPQGPAAMYLRQHPGAFANVMTPAEKQMMARSRGGRTAFQPSSVGQTGEK